MTKKKAIVVGVALAAIAIVLFAFFVGLNGPEPAAVEDTTQGDTPAALTVTVAPPERSVWPETVTASGWTTAWKEVVISAEVGNQKIIAVHADVGDSVKTGDVLVELSRETLENDIAELKATLESSQAALDLAVADADRARQLRDSGKGSLSQQGITEYLVTERKAKAEVASNEAQLASALLDLERTKILAVTDGVISSRSAVLGAVTSAGEEVFRMIQDGRIEWQAEVPLRQLFQIKAGTQVKISTPIGEVTGAVRQIAPTASESNGRVKVYVTLDKLSGAPDPKTGVMISGTFLLGESEAIHVPSSAITQQDGLNYVFILSPDNPTKVQRLRVETGRRQGDRIELVDNFAMDSEVVQSGGAFLADGATVKVVVTDPGVSSDAPKSAIAGETE